MPSAEESSLEVHFREAIAQELMRRAETNGGFLRWSELTSVLHPDGIYRRVVDPGRGGIWNPSHLTATLSIVTSPDGPYADTEIGGMLRYHYQSGPAGGKNVKLRRAMELGLPVIRFHKVAPNAYAPIYPVYVVADDVQSREFTLAVDLSLQALPAIAMRSEIERRYAERVVMQRVHQPAFRARVMLAYETRCAVCVLKKAPLLDAAHIIGDSDDMGDAIITNGLSLCKIHHAAYDQNLLGITPDFRVKINSSLLDEIDGPMLRHGLQEMNGRELWLPKAASDRPDIQRIAFRYDQFLAS
ncbi:HNH endonuclease [Nocardioides rubriscoriae]|uniref:HNH endonuclease n=1 Tax=Nocardioides rubriscoriae TaxID=642762 RepID=UPI0011DF5E6A|nr:HNH endonuclease [Nocardioides rubriscoriae]